MRCRGGAWRDGKISNILTGLGAAEEHGGDLTAFVQHQIHRITAQSPPLMSIVLEIRFGSRELCSE